MSINSDKLEEVIRKHSLLNAYLHKGKAQPQVVLGKIIGEMPWLREKAKEVLEKVKVIVEEVNRLSVEEQKRTLEENWPELLQAKAKPEKKVLPPLPNVEKYSKVVTRFSPNPDCVLHLGSARAVVLSWKYAKMYNGEFYLRFEDTDPRYKRPVLEFYDLIREDLIWLGCRWDKEIIQSDRLEIYYEYAKRLLEVGGGYVCTCQPQTFKEKILSCKPCPCRELPKETQLERWEKMLDGSFGEGEAVVRVKTDLNHPNPAVRDWPAIRIIDTKKFPHPRVGDKYRVWPLYNFSSGLDDHLLGITHIIRGKEHLTNEQRQRFLYNYFGWDYPEAIHYGRLKITGAVLSKSEIKLGVEKGVYGGYGDPRLATLIALRRRGITAEAVVRLMLEVGVKPVDVTLSWENLYAYNRKILDPKADRYFFVSNPIKLEVLNVEKPYTAKLHLHPDYPEKGFRVFQLKPENGRLTLLVSTSDLNLLKPEKVVRLMGLFNIQVKNVEEKLVKAVFHSETYEEAKKLHAPLIHYLPPTKGVKTVVVMPDGSTIEGLAEESCGKLKAGDVIQFERFGFVKIEKVNQEILAYYTHK
ncbi:MAG: glutamate--tRNA ligase [Candidatus Hecatellales archaeon]|nr:MAG: glutamate--tRNA ligase [Candidatus Hecatellales archaeon]